MTGCDFIIVGGGIAGIGAAAHLAPHGKVVVLEAEDALGHHATGRSAAIFIRNYGNTTLKVLNAAAEPFFREPAGILEESLFSPRGEMIVAGDDDLEAFESYLEGTSGIDLLTPAEAVALVPILNRDRIVAAAIERDAQDIDVDRLLQGYARRARKEGTEIRLGAEVRGVTRQASGWRVETAAGLVEGPVLVNAAGAWADNLARLAGVAPVGLTPMRRSAAILPAPAGYDISRWPLFTSAAETWYAKPEAGKLMVSPADEDPVEPHDAWPDDMVLAEGLHAFEQAVTVPVTRVERSWAGLRTFAPDRTPVVGFAADAEGFFWLAGQGGYGVQTAPALSRLAADLCLGRAPFLDQETVAALSPGRFLRRPGPVRP